MWAFEKRLREYDIYNFYDYVEIYIHISLCNHKTYSVDARLMLKYMPDDIPTLHCIAITKISVWCNV